MAASTPSPDVDKRVKAELEPISEIPGLVLIRPKVFPDERGFFSESYNVDEWREQLNFHEIFKQVAGTAISSSRCQ